jgi:hypothetical protein
MRKKWFIHYCAGKFPSWKMSSLLGSTSHSGSENIHHSSKQASSMIKIPSFPQQTNSMAKFHHFLKESKLPQREKDVISFHPSKCIMMITIIFKFIYLFILSTWALHCCALLVIINQSIDEKNELIL